MRRAAFAMRRAAVFRGGTMHRTEKRTLTRARLVEAALNVFAFEGYEHATVDDIAHAAGLSKGAFYFNFTSKEEVLLELLRRWSEERALLLRAAYLAEPDPAARVESMVRALIAYEGGANWPPLVLEFWSQALRAGEVNRRVRRAYDSWKRQLVVALKATHDSAPGESADAILAIHDASVSAVALGRAAGGPGAMPERLCRMVLWPRPQGELASLAAAGA